MHLPHLKELGALDPRSWDDPTNRSWVFRTVGEGTPATGWAAFLEALTDAGYDGELSIENADPFLPGASGVRRAVAFMGAVLPREAGR